MNIYCTLGLVPRHPKDDNKHAQLPSFRMFFLLGGAGPGLKVLIRPYGETINPPMQSCHTHTQVETYYVYIYIYVAGFCSMAPVQTKTYHPPMV